MPLNHLFDIGTRYRSTLLLAITDDKPDFKVRGTAYLLDLQERSVVGKFAVRYERPGFRLALSYDDQVCCVGCYEAYGLAGYSTLSGQEEWRRKDLKSVQVVVSSELQDWVFCGRQSGAAYLVKASTGETVEKLAGVKGVYPSPFDKSVLVAGRGMELHRPFGTRLARLKDNPKMISSCCFSRSEFMINEMENVRCYDLNSQELLWTHELPPKSFLPRMCFHEDSGCFVAVERRERVLFFEARTGAVKRKVTLLEAPGLVYAFCNRGAAIFAPNLCLVSSETGAVIEDFATPELIAWDPLARLDRLRELAESKRSFEELHRYVQAEGFSKADAFRVLFWKVNADRKQ